MPGGVKKHELPRGWAWTTLGELLREPLKNGYSARASSDGTGIRTLILTAVTANDFSERNTKLTVAKADEVEDLWLQPGDIFVERSNTPELVGTAALYRGEAHYAIYPDLLIRVRAHTEISPSYLHALFEHQPSRHFYRLRAKGLAGSMPKIDQATVAALPVPLAPLAEQQRIVAKVEELFSDLDAGVAALKRVRAGLKRYRASVLRAAVEGRLTAHWRAAHPTAEPASELLARVLADSRAKWEADQLAKFAAANKTPPKNWQAKYPEPAAPNTTGLPGLPKGWCWVTLEQLNPAERPMSYGVLQPGEDVSEGVPLVRVCDVGDGHVAIEQLKKIDPSIAAQYQRTVLRGGEVLLTIVGTIGRSAVAPAILQGANTARAVAVIPITQTINPQYVEMNLRESGMRARLTSAAHEVARKTLNLEDVRVACIPLASTEEQEQIVAAVEERLSIAVATERQVDADLARAARLRQAILKRAFAGKLAPQDPSDEPASALLERIRASRAQAPLAKTRRPRKSTEPAPDAH